MADETELDILASAGFGDSNEQDQADTGAGEVEEAASTSQSQAQEEDTSEHEEQDTTREEHVVDAQPKRDERKPDEGRLPTRRYVDYNYDAKGNVVDPKSGRVLYQAGTPANKMFRELRNLQFQSSRTTKDLGKAIELGKGFEAQVRAYENTFADAKQAGLTAEDTQRAVRVFASLKTKPVETLRYLLTKAQADGTDLADIFDNVQSLQTSGIKAMIDERLKPLTAKTEADATEQQVRQRAAQDTEAFLEEFPEAELHAEVIAGQIQDATAKGQKLSVRDAYAKLTHYCAQRGLDITKPLKPQMEARQNGGGNKPLPRGNGNGRGFTSRDKAPGYRDRPNRDIVKEAMQEAGIRFDD